MHAGFAHIFFNMFAVWMFGRILEQVWGPKRFLFYYLVCGIGAGIIQEVVQYIHYETVLSAYDSVNTAWPSSRWRISQYDDYRGSFGSSIRHFAGIRHVVPQPANVHLPTTGSHQAKYFVIGYALIELYAGFANNAGDNVAHFAHLGGMVFGFIMIMYWRKKNRGNGYYYN